MVHALRHDARVGPAAVTPVLTGGTAAAATNPARTQTAGADALGPRARCGDRNFLSLLVCMKRECEAPSLAGHPECVRMREQEEAAQRSSR